MRRISWISSTVLAAPGASFTAGVLSVIIRPKQLEDYTVTHNAETDVWRRALLPVCRAQLAGFFVYVKADAVPYSKAHHPSNTKEEQCPARDRHQGRKRKKHLPHGATACTISKPGCRKWLKPLANWWRSNLPAITNPPETASELSSQKNFVSWAAKRECTAPRSMRIICKSISPDAATAPRFCCWDISTRFIRWAHYPLCCVELPVIVCTAPASST